MNRPKTPLTSAETAVSRRDFLASAARTSGAFIVGCLFSGQVVTADEALANELSLNAWVRITPQNEVTIIISQAEMGQGIMSTLPAILAEELGADWEKVKLEMAPVAPAYRNPRLNFQFTGNSESTMSFFDLMRRVGASAREMLISAAADRWHVARSSCIAEAGEIIERKSALRFTFGQLAEAASKQRVPANPPFKAPSDWRLLGKPLPRVDNPSKVDGSAVFGLDFKLPNMVYAAVRHCPVPGGKLVSIDRTSVAGFPDIVALIEVPGGVAVVAPRYWQAKTALDALRVDWDDGPAATLNSDTIMEEYRAAMSGQDWVLVRQVGNPDAIQHSYPNVRLSSVAQEKIQNPVPFAESFNKIHSSEYESQFLAHAAMEPMNATASVSADKCAVWAPTQGQELAQLMVAQFLGLPKEKIEINRTFLGGGFGRRLVADFVLEAVAASKAVGRPVKVVWSREEDIQHDVYRPAVRHRITVGLNSENTIAAAAHQLVSPSILHYVYPVAVKDDYDPSCLEGLHGTRYKIPNVRVDFHLLKAGVPASTSVLRTTGYGPNIFATESHIDDLAHQSGKDPYQFRRNLLKEDARALAVLDMAAAKSAWTEVPERGVFRGIAFTEAFATLICQVVELSVTGNWVHIHRVISAIDCGTVLNPNIAANNIEGGVAWGLSAAFKSEITFDRGRTVQSNFHDYQILRLSEMPAVEVYFVDSGARPLGGTGEVGPVTVVPAVANALFVATGQRYRSLPLSRYGLRLA
ncbi:MAG: xanthine dehydrogenase family protein molybdopterin-binding subunit [Acidobacteria bacterium]|nr:xanthine dehydrogenase family protein molybdopterin-binding subunit [Acidobacteriota bacterium]